MGYLFQSLVQQPEVSMSAYQTSCGEGSCSCSCLLLDFDLAKAWFNTACQYFELAKKPLKDVVLRQVLQPWKLSNLQEHEACFQHWNVLQLWIGIVATLVILLMNFIWFLVEDNELAKPALSNVFLNAIVGLALNLFFTHLAWFGVMNKQGCCCLVLCCCVGKPNLLVVAILSVLFGILGLISAFSALGSVQGALIIVVLVWAIFALLHGIALIYLGFESFIIWKISTSTPAQGSVEPKKVVGDQVVIGASQGQGGEEARTDVEVGEVKAEA